MTMNAYQSLQHVFEQAFAQAANGKGKERHVTVHEEPFEKQQIVEIGKRLQGNCAAGPLFQAVKKIYESGVLPKDMAINELLGAMNYIAAAVILFEQEEDSPKEIEVKQEEKPIEEKSVAEKLPEEPKANKRGTIKRGEWAAFLSKTIR